MKIKQLLICFFVFTLLSCEHKNQFNINDYVQRETDDLEYSVFNNEVRVPYKEIGGVKMLKCLINGTILADMILDSGCSGTLVSIEEARYLAAKGALTENDYRGSTETSGCRIFLVRLLLRSSYLLQSVTSRHLRRVSRN